MLKNPWLILLGVALLSLVIVTGIVYFALNVPTPSVGISSQQEQNKSKQPNNNTNIKTGESEQHPAFIKIVPADATPDETSYRSYEEKEKPPLDRWLTYATISLSVFTFFLFCGTVILAVYTFKLWVEASETSKRQANEMQNSIAEATRAATAMEQVAKNSAESVTAVKQRTAQQMRAYLTVIIGNAAYQDRATNTKFAGYPRLINTGHTPAHKVKFKARAIISAALPDNFDFPLPGEFIGASVLGPQQFNDLRGIVDDFVPDDEVVGIKHGQGKFLYIWGLVS